MEEIIVGGGVQTYNVFLDKDLVTDIYFNVTPMVIGDGGTIGSKDDLFVKFDKMNYEPIIENVIRLHLINNRSRYEKNNFISFIIGHYNGITGSRIESYKFE